MNSALPGTIIMVTALAGRCLFAEDEVVSTILDDAATLDVTIVTASDLAPAPTPRAAIERQEIVQQRILPEATTKVREPLPRPGEAPLPFVDTISGAELKQFQRQDLADVVRQSAGVSVVSTGQRGSQTSLFIRGFESDHTVVLLNGRRLPRGLAGLYQVEFLDSNFLEKVELVRGPSSSLWGSDAIAGVINLQTTDARYVTSDTVQAYAEGGSFETFRSGGKITVRDGGIGLALDGTFLDTANDRPHSDHENATFRGNIAVEWNDGLFFDVLGYVQDGEVIAPNGSNTLFFPEEQRNRNQSSLFSPRISIERENWSASAFYSYTDNELIADRTSFFAPGDGGLDTKLDQVGHEIESVIHFHPSDETRWTLGAGNYDYEFTREPLTPGPFNNPANAAYGFWSLFGQTELDLANGFDFLSSVRHDEHDSFRSETTYSVQLARTIEYTGTQIFGKVATGYKTPTGQDFIFLDPSVDPSTLQPEESESWEVGLRQNLPDDSGSVAVTYFRADIENLIDSAFDFTTFTSFPAEVDARTEGVEIELQLTPVEGFDTYATYTWLDATITDGFYLGGFGGGPGDRLPRRPTHSVTTGGVLHGDGWRVGAEIRGAYSRFDAAPSVFIDDYTVARLFGDVRVAQNATLYGRIENVFDSEYEETTGFEGPGIGAFGGIRLLFGK